MAANPDFSFTVEDIAKTSKPVAHLMEYILNLIGASET